MQEALRDEDLVVAVAAPELSRADHKFGRAVQPVSVLKDVELAERGPEQFRDGSKPKPLPVAQHLRERGAAEAGELLQRTSQTRRRSLMRNSERRYLCRLF